jgi:nicotinate dehydrogenase subunit B
MTGRPSRRGVLCGAGALVVSFAWHREGAAQWADQEADQMATQLASRPRILEPGSVDAFFAISEDGSVTLYCGKVDLGTGLRIAIPQMAAEELGVAVGSIRLVEGDTALTPDQGPTAGSTGIARGGMQIRQAAATARQALIRLGAARLDAPVNELVAEDGEVRWKAAGKAIGFGALLAGQQFAQKVDAKAPLRTPEAFTIIGKSLPRPDVPAKVTGRHVYVHDFALPGMLHGRAIRPPRVGAGLVSVDETSIAHLADARIVRINHFLAVVAEQEWDAVRAARAIKAEWTGGGGLMGDAAVAAAMRAGPFLGQETLTARGDPTALLTGSQTLKATFYWPPQTHGSIGPSCAVADVRADEATVWTASQATHKFQPTFAAMLGLPNDKVRLIYLDGAGCYGMNGHDDAAADAALLSKAVGRPVRVQWTRQDEHGWDPKGPPQLIDLSGVVSPDGAIAAWRTEMWLPKATAGLPNVPLLAPEAAGLPQAQGLSTGLISQNGAPPYAADRVEVIVHWLKDAPLRPSNIRAPGKIANVFAVESFVDILAHAAGRDPLAFRLSGLRDPRGIEVLQRVAAMMRWQPRAGARGDGRGRGIAFVHYKDNETYVAMAMDIEVERRSGAIHVARVACAHDCGLVINPDAVKAQVEGAILQTLSRALLEEVKFDHDRVTSTDWSSYPILTFRDVPKIEIDLVLRQDEPPLGAGEAAATPVAAALANAIFDATAARLTTIPFTAERVKAALAQRAG